MAYKRLTKWISGVPAIKTYTGSYMTPFDSDVYDAIKRLAELEDKIEQGKLIEFPRLDRYVCYYSGLEKYVVQWVDNGIIKNKTFWNEKKAEKKLKELQNG